MDSNSFPMELVDLNFVKLNSPFQSAGDAKLATSETIFWVLASLPYALNMIKSP